MDHGIATFLRFFFRVWTQPRQVMKTILSQEPGYHVWTFVVFYAILQAFQPEFYILFLGKTTLDMLLLAGILISVGADVAACLFLNACFYFVGRLMGGKGSWKDILTAFGWCYPPAIIGIIFLQLSNIPQWLRISAGETDVMTLIREPRVAWQSGCQALSFLLAMWTLVLWVVNISEAHKISIPRSLVLVLVPFLIYVFIAIGIIICVAFYLLHPH